MLSNKDLQTLSGSTWSRKSLTACRDSNTLRVHCRQNVLAGSVLSDPVDPLQNNQQRMPAVDIVLLCHLFC